MSRNHLGDETSPYLLQHKDNPVHWHPWNPETLALAQQEGKPILLSIGYAACHWCHVMAHESFENPDIAGLMNDLYVNVKVDREERPDLDVIYQTALALMGEQGGWPLTMFLTPAGDPFWGGTYFPPTERYGRPAFPDILNHIADAYRTQGERVQQNVAALRHAMDELTRPQGGKGLSIDLLDRTAAFAIRMIDPVHGGTTGAPKFPQVPYLRFLWRAFKRTGSHLYREAVMLSLVRMCQGGIYDHLGGGFARYSTDEVWLVPHFEKMLYDNALLLDLLTEVWQTTRNPLFAARARETVAWILREMTVTDGGHDDAFAFASALDADSEGVEGRFYVWSESEIDSLLGPDAVDFKQAYDVTPRGNWEGTTILNRTHNPEGGAPELEARLTANRETLLAARETRPRPQRDDKVLTDWNALMVTALARAGATFQEPDWIDAARRVFAFVCTRMIRDGRLRHAWRADRARHRAVLDDYATMARAAVALNEVTGEAAYLHQADSWVDVANRRYWDHERGGYFMSADDTTDVITRSKTIADNATPSANGLMVEVLARLHLLTGNADHRARAEQLVTLFSGDEPKHLFNMPTLLNGFELLDRGLQVVIVTPTGDADFTDPNTEALFRAAIAAGLHDKVISRMSTATPLPPGHPAAGKGPVDGAAAAYVCAGPTCSLPVTDADVLRAELDRHAAATAAKSHGP